MPELPDIVIYVDALQERILGHKLNRVLIRAPFLLRSAKPPIDSVHGKLVRAVRRVGKRIAIGLEGDLWLVLHLMIAGRLHWRDRITTGTGRRTLATFEFDSGSLLVTEAGSQHRAALNVVAGEEGLASLHAGGIEVLEADLPAFAAAIRSSNHTLKRALTDPRILSGIGNAYSDEILHSACLSPLGLTQTLTEEEVARLYTAIRDTLALWIDRLRSETGPAFPEGVTAFREGMAVHGRYGQPCPRCGAKIQRIRYASNETNYCPKCQTHGRLLADRALSRLLREDWPRTLEELEQIRSR